jgi:hypothetical protein
VVVNQFNVKGVLAFKAENNAPVGPNGHGPKSFQVAFERVKAITWNVKSVGRRRGVKGGENAFRFVHKIGPDAAAVGALVKAVSIHDA